MLFRRWLLSLFLLVVLLSVAWVGFIWWYYYSGDGEAANLHFETRPVDVQVTEIRDGIYLLQGLGGNVTALTGPDGLMIVDTDLPRVFPALKAALAELSPLPVRYVVNTHVHFDHTGSNSKFRAEGADILALPETIANIMADKSALRTEEDYPNVAVFHGQKMTLNGQTLTFLHAPNAHTNGDLIIRIMPADVIVAGDIYVENGLPYLDLTRGANLARHLAGQKQILNLAGPDTIVVPGHGLPTGKAEMLDIHHRLEQAHDYIAWLAGFGLPRRFLYLLAHPVNAWPLAKRKGDTWERYWVSLVINGLQKP